MNFTKNDMMILVGSFMVILFMTLVFPALGLTTDGAEQSNVPELDFSENSVELVGERPRWPRTPTSGETFYSYSGGDERSQVIHRDGEYVVFVEGFCFDGEPIDDCRVQLSVFDVNDYNELSYQTITQEDFEDRTIIEISEENSDGDTWTVQFEPAHYNNWGSEDMEMYIEWDLVESPESGGWLSGVPILGGIYATADAVASVLAWFITIFFWFCTWFVELVINAIAMLIHGVLFGFDIVNFMLTNYNGMISDTSGFASFILIVPGMLLSVELLKLGFIFISILPTT